MKNFSILFSLILGFTVNVYAETAVQKVDRTAHEAVDEVKTATKTIVRKMKKNTNTNPDVPEKTDEAKKKDLKE